MIMWSALLLSFALGAPDCQCRYFDEARGKWIVRWNYHLEDGQWVRNWWAR